MASRSLARKTAPAPHAPAARAPRAAGASASPAASPARLLQDELGARLLGAADAIPADGRWSARRTLVFAVCASTALWGVFAAGGYLLFRA